MPRWIIIVLVVTIVLWLAGVGLSAFAHDDAKPDGESAEKQARSWFGGLGSILPEPEPLSASDVEVSAGCGVFPVLEIPTERTCEVVVREGRGRHGATIQLLQGSADLSVTPPRGKGFTRELEQRQEVALRFDDDGGTLNVHCRAESPACRVRLVKE